MNKVIKFEDYVLRAVGIVILIMFLMLMFETWQTLRSGSKECMENGLVYGAKVIKDQTGNSLSCTCMLENYPNVKITFNDTYLNAVSYGSRFPFS